MEFNRTIGPLYEVAGVRVPFGKAVVLLQEDYDCNLPLEAARDGATVPVAVKDATVAWLDGVFAGAARFPIAVEWAEDLWRFEDGPEWAQMLKIHANDPRRPVVDEVLRWYEEVTAAGRRAKETP